MSNLIPPASLKGINIFLKTAAEIETRDPIVAYYCRLYALEKGMTIDKRSPEARTFLTELMTALESAKTNLNATHPEVFSHDSVVGQAAVENKAVQLFTFADNRDRAGDFGPATVKSFYTAGILLDVLQTFGAVNEELEKCRKYAKWKALYITQCRKNNETPQAGPLGGEGEEAPNLSGYAAAAAAASGAAAAAPGAASGPAPGPTPGAASGLATGAGAASWTAPGAAHEPGPSGSAAAATAGPPGAHLSPGGAFGGLSVDHYTRAGKYCKFAGSALQYQDARTAIDYLCKALNLLQTGEE